MAALSLLLLLATQPLAAGASPISWSQPRPVDPGATLQLRGAGDIACPSDAFCLAVGSFGNLIGSTEPGAGAAAWSPAHIDEARGNELTAISCPSTAFCAAVDRGGNVMTSTDPLGGSEAWSGVHLAGAGHLTDVSCASASFCATVDDDGSVFTASDPGGGAAAWHAATIGGGDALEAISCPTASFCAAVNFGSPFNSDVVVSTAPSGPDWKSVGLDIHGRTEDISCASASFCAAVSEEETLVSTDPTGGVAAWEESGGGAGLRHIACPSAGFCAAVGTSGELRLSAEPAGAAAWSETDITPDGSSLMSGISCPSAGFCATVEAGGDTHVSSDPAGGPGAWSVADTGGWSGGITAVACPLASLCAATAEDGKLFTTTDPAAANWSQADIGGTARAVSCASASWCVALGSGPALLYSTDPGGGAGAWASAAMPAAATDISCPSPAFCAATDGQGDILTSTEPTAGAGTWTVTDLELPDWRLGQSFMQTISCPSADFCAAGGSVGTVVASSAPTGGAASWVRAFVGNPHYYYNGAGPEVNGISCPEPDFCAATTWGDSVSTTSEALGGTGAWSVSEVQAADWPTSISCPSASLCVAVDRAGDAISSRAPAASPWNVAFVDGYGELTGVSCAPEASLCVGVDDSGYAVVGVPNPDDGAVPPSAGNASPATGAGGSEPANTRRPRKSHRCKPTAKKHGKRDSAGRPVSSAGRRSRSRCPRHGGSRGGRGTRS